MLIAEVLVKIVNEGGEIADQQDALLTILLNLQSTAKNSGNPQDAIINFTELQDAVYNTTHMPMTWEGFNTLKDMNPAIQQIISKDNEEEIVLNTGEKVEVSWDNPDVETPPEEIVGDMANRARKKRKVGVPSMEQ